MDTFLETVASNAVLATLIAVLVAVLTRFVRRPELAYWLWMLVLVKLVTPPIVGVPFRLGEAPGPGSVGEDAALRSPLSEGGAPALRPVTPRPFAGVPDLPPAEELTTAEGPDVAGEVTLATPPATVPHASEGAAATVGVTPTERWAAFRDLAAAVSWSTVILGVWLLGSLSWFVLAGVRLFRFGRLVAQAGPAPEHLQAVGRQLARRLGIRRCPEIRVLAARIPPLLWWSTRRAVILLPSGLLSQLEVKEQTVLLAHDLAHYRRGDHLVRWAEALILGLYWWHPVVWWARRRLRQAEEQCCDAWVLWALPGAAKRYAHTLLTAVEFLSVSRAVLPAEAPGLEQVGSLKRRLEMILKESVRRRMSWAGLVTVLLVALLVLPWSARSAPGRAAQEAEAVTSPQQSPAVEAVEQEALGVEPASLPEQITGVVLAPDGSPVAGAHVYLVTRETWAFSGRLLYFARPVEERAGVRLGPQTLARAHTDATGRFAVQLGAEAVKELTATQIEFLSSRAHHDRFRPTIVAAAEGQALGYQGWDKRAQHVEIRIPESVSIRGRLLTHDGDPAEGVLVSVTEIRDEQTRLGYWWRTRFPDDHKFPGYWPAAVRTDAVGSFTLAVMPRGFRAGLALTHPDLASEWLSIDTQLSEPETDEDSRPTTLPPTFTHQLEPTRMVEGTVTASDTGKPLAGVFLQIVPMGERGGYRIYGRSDEQGRYRVAAKAEPRCYYEVHPAPDSGYLSVRASEDPVPEEAKSLVKDFSLDRGKIVRGRVLDAETGKPIGGASVIYRPSRANYFAQKEYEFDNPALTDDEGRFAVTGLSGPGYVMVETPDRSYLRSPDTRLLRADRSYGGQPLPVGLTPVSVPVIGDLQEDVVVRLERGRRVTLEAVGPTGEPLPWVAAAWEGSTAEFDWGGHDSLCFADGKVVVPGLDPGLTLPVFLFNTERKLGAVFDVTPDVGDGPIEVRLQPTATVTGQAVTPEGEPDEDAHVSLKMSFDLGVSLFTWEDHRKGRYEYYSNVIRNLDQEDPPYPDGRFTLEYVLPGVPFGLALGESTGPNRWKTLDIITIEPLEPGQRRDLGKLVIAARPKDEPVAVDVPPFEEGTHQGGELKMISGIPVLFLQGGPEEMGEQQAALVIRTAKPMISLPRKIMRNPPDALWSAMVQLARAAVTRVPDRYRRELDAAARAAKLTQEETDALLVANGLIELAYADACAALLVEPERSATGEALFGRNFDVDSYGCLDKLTLVTVYRPAGRHAFASVGFVTFGGVISGMNDAGLAVALLFSGPAGDNSPRVNPLGTPMALTFRRILEECTTVAEAGELLRNTKHTLQVNLAACDTRRAVVFEITPENVITRNPEDHRMAATNHFRSPELSAGTQSIRYQKIEPYLERSESLGLADVHQAMRDAARDDTLHTMIFEPKSLKLHLAVGQPATDKPLVTLNLAELFRHGVPAE
jgi:beta-lactamase regulating signal transducer with metallopeptidase domain